MRYGVQYDHTSGTIEAGSVRAVDDQEAFILHSDVTGQAVLAVIRWLRAHDDGLTPYQITDGDTTFGLVAFTVQTPEGT